MTTELGPEGLVELLHRVKKLAKEYREVAGRPLGVTGEVAEYEAVRLLGGLKLAPVRQEGYDAQRWTDAGSQLVQIKGRCVRPGTNLGQRIGRIDLNREWDVVLLVLMDEHFETTAIYEADRAQLTAALSEPGSRARNERGQLGVGKFKAIGRQVWPPL